MTRTQSLLRIFRWPLIIAASSLIGLLSALVGNGLWDGLSWIMLAPPVWIGMAAFYGHRKQEAMH